jgi:hypothetical protein
MVVVGASPPDPKQARYKPAVEVRGHQKEKVDSASYIKRFLVGARHGKALSVRLSQSKYAYTCPSHPALAVKPAGRFYVWV